MKSRLLLTAAAIPIAACVWLFAGVDAATNVFRTALDLESLRATLEDPASFDTLHRLSSKWAVWAVYTEAALEQEPEGDGALLHHFELAHRLGLSTKSYRLTFRSTHISDEEFAIEILPGGFVSRDRPPAGEPPALDGPRYVEVLRALLRDEGTEEDPGVYPTLISELEKHVFIEFHILRRLDLQFGPEQRVYDIEFLARHRQTGDLSLLRFRVRYDTAAERVGSFRRLDSQDR